MVFQPLKASPARLSNCFCYDARIQALRKYDTLRDIVAAGLVVGNTQIPVESRESVSQISIGKFE